MQKLPATVKWPQDLWRLEPADYSANEVAWQGDPLSQSRLLYGRYGACQCGDPHLRMEACFGSAQWPCHHRSGTPQASRDGSTVLRSRWLLAVEYGLEKAKKRIGRLAAFEPPIGQAHRIEDQEAQQPKEIHRWQASSLGGHEVSERSVQKQMGQVEEQRNSSVTNSGWRYR